MTKAEALAEARKRWGGNPHRFVTVLEYVRRGKSHFAVGYEVAGIYSPTPKFKAMGRGASWEAAFADADRRAK